MLQSVSDRLSQIRGSVVRADKNSNVHKRPTLYNSFEKPHWNIITPIMHNGPANYFNIKAIK